MAKFKPPENFNFEKPGEWPSWRQRFTRFRSASKLSLEDADVQVSTLIYAMGNEAENIFKTFTFTEEEDENDYETVLEKFDEYFIPKRNTIHERACFYQRQQKPGEMAETFIRALHELSENCEFGDKKNEHIRDRLVVGIRDKDLSRKLQLTSDLTLEKAVLMVRQAEEVAQQITQQEQQASLAVQAVEQKRFVKKGGKPQRERSEGQRHGYQGESKCNRCGKEKHRNAAKCPATDSECRKCGKKGHWERKCFTKTVREVNQGNEEDESFYLGAVSKQKQSSEEQWTEQIHIGYTPVRFRIDTGADVTVMNMETFRALKPERKLEPHHGPLDSPGGTLDIMGQFTASTLHKQRKHIFNIYVARGPTVNNLLARDTAVEMRLVKRIQQVKATAVYQGTMKTDPVKVHLRDDAVPHAVHTTRRVPLPLLPKVQAELQRMEEHGVIVKVTQPTEWCAPMVPVLKPTGAVRICVGLQKLNENLKRETYQLPTTDETLAKLAGSTVFTSLDAASGFWQIPLHEESRILTTFITPFGRYCFTRLPFGINIAPEIFQRKMHELLDGLEGVAGYMDDVIVHGKDKATHDRHLQSTLERMKQVGLKLNEEKCVYAQPQLRFLGHIVDANGVRADPEKVSAVRELDVPTNVHELKRALGMINYMSKYIPDMATVAGPLYDLLKGKMAWTWDQPQQRAFQRLKEALVTSPVLAHYDPQRPTAVSADASSYGMGGVLLQLHGESWKPVAYCSRRLSDAETRYAQIEKECLAGVWACERFQKYLVGMDKFRLITDHKPLVPLINSKDLDAVPVRCQRLLMRLMRFNAKAEYAPGKTLVIADALSRSPLKERDSSTEAVIACHVNAVTHSWPVSQSKLDRIRTATQEDSQLQRVRKLIRDGWPKRVSSTSHSVRDYYMMRDSLSECEGLITLGCRIVIPQTLRQEVLDRIHEGHQSLSKCRERAQETVWWPKMSGDIKRKIDTCHFCQTNRRTQRREQLLSTPLPERPWQKIATDICEYKGKQYLVISDYYSRYLEILHLPTTTTEQVVRSMKATFARFGIPELIVSDNGPQYTSDAWKEFCRLYDIEHSTSSPHNPQGNGHAERAVQTAKRILKQDDPLLALMSYRATPTTSTGVSPAEMLMGRKIRTTLPSLKKNLIPRQPNRDLIRRRDEEAKQQQAFYYNRRHGARNLPPLHTGDHILSKLDGEKMWKGRASVLQECGTPRSFQVKSPGGGEMRRNRRHLQQVPPLMEEENTDSGQPATEPEKETPHDGSDQGLCESKVKSPIVTPERLTVTRFGRVSRPVKRMDI